MNTEEIIQFLEHSLSTKVISCIELAASGSARKNYILETSEKKFVITDNSNVRENECFIYFSTIFEQLHLNTPTILAISNDRKTYIQTYLGAKTLSEIIGVEGENERVKKLTQQVLDHLFQLQNATVQKIDYSQTFEYNCYNALPILHDLNYFKFLLVDVLEIEYHKTSLLLEFNELAKEIEKLNPQALMIRDFQARNIMVNESDEVFFIDYQSAMLGPRMYDVISFLYQAKANFSNHFKLEMLNYYYQKHNPSEILLLQQATPYIQLIRFLQVLGAYGFRGLVQRKKHFLESLPMGIQNLNDFAQQWTEINQYPELLKIIVQLQHPKTLRKIKTIST